MILPFPHFVGLLIVWAAVQRCADRRVDAIGSRTDQQLALPDLLFDLVPRTSLPSWVADAAPAVPIVALLIAARRAGKLYAVAQDYVSTYAIVMLVRSVAMNITVLPSPHCTRGRRDAWYAYHGFGKCHDLIFSGHSSASIIAVFYLVSLGHAKVWLLWPMVVGLLLIATRMHYSIDILVAWAVCISVIALLQLRSRGYRRCLMPH